MSEGFASELSEGGGAADAQPSTADDGVVEVSRSPEPAAAAAGGADPAHADADAPKETPAKMARTNAKGKKPGKLESAAQIRGMIAGMPLVAALDLSGEPAAVLASWYETTHAYFRAATKVLDMAPERKEQVTRLEKLNKLLKALQELYENEAQLEKEMAGRQNQANAANLTHLILKSKRSSSRHAQGTQHQEVVEAMLHPDLPAEEARSQLVLATGQVTSEINQLKVSQMTLTSEHREKEGAMKRLQGEMDDLDRQVCNLVKKGYHRASLVHHPDKLEGEISDEQHAYWRTVQLGLDVLSSASSRREYFDTRDHAKFVKIREQTASGALRLDTDAWQKRLTGNLPSQCSLPMLCEEDELHSGTTRICLIWTCRNAVTMEVTRYQVQAIKNSDGDFATADQDKILSWWTDTMEFKGEFRHGEYSFRTRALNVVGPGPWSYPLQLTLRDSNVSDAMQRQASKIMLRKAREVARRNQQEEARTNVLSNMSTLACRHSHAYDNLKTALQTARKVCVSPNSCAVCGLRLSVA